MHAPLPWALPALYLQAWSQDPGRESDPALSLQLLGGLHGTQFLTSKMRVWVRRSSAFLPFLPL